ncbi:MAG: GNAT family N-acetyltransferase, partial [Methylobacteriaceae bacterium]|nr:GNAT family N-acetyltransferase [Methylobacteriaceae bacterium]
MFPELTSDDVFRLETARLWLRWPRQSDAPTIMRLAGDKAVSEMTAKLPHSLTKEAAEQFVFEARRANAGGASLTLMACLREKPDQVIGLVSIFRSDDGETPQIGYWLAKRSWGQGLMTEIIHATLDMFFFLTGEPVLHASTRLNNPASRRVLEKCAFEFEGEGFYEAADGRNFVVHNYRVTRDAWLR